MTTELHGGPLNGRVEDIHLIPRDRIAYRPGHTVYVCHSTGHADYSLLWSGAHGWLLERIKWATYGRWKRWRYKPDEECDCQCH